MAAVTSRARCTAAQKATTASPIRPAAVRTPVAAKASQRDAVSSVMGAVAASVLLLASPVYAEEQTLNTLTGPTPAPEVGRSVLDDLPKVDESVRKQPTDAVKQAADDVRQVLVNQASELTQDPAGAAAKVGDQQGKTRPSEKKATEQNAQGLQANLAQLKSLLGL